MDLSETSSTRQKTPWGASLFSGFTIGVTEALVNHPLWVLKTRFQAGWPFTLRPAVLYRGIITHMVSSVPVDTIALGAARAINERALPENMSPTAKRIIAGFFGGILAGFAGSTCEMAMTWQQKEKSFSRAVRMIVQSVGPAHLMTGSIALSLREGVFWVGTYSATNLIEHNLRARGKGKLFSTFVAGLSSGVVCSFISQPFDNIKLVMQISPRQCSLIKTIGEMAKKEGHAAFFRGYNLRVLRVALAVMIEGALNNECERRFF